MVNKLVTTPKLIDDDDLFWDNFRSEAVVLLANSNDVHRIKPVVLV